MDLTTIIKLDLTPTFVANVEGTPANTLNNFTSNVNGADGIYYQVRSSTIAGLGQAAALRSDSICPSRSPEQRSRN